MENAREFSRIRFFLTAYIALLPIGLGILTKHIIPSDMLALMAIFSVLVFALKSKQIHLNLLDSLFISFIGLSLMGTNVLSNYKPYFFEISALTFLYLTARTISFSLVDKKSFRQILYLISHTFIVFLCVSAVIIICRVLSVESFTDYFYSAAMRYKGLFRRANQLGIFCLSIWPLAVMPYANRIKPRFFLYGLFLLLLAANGARSTFWLGIIQTICIETILPDRKSIISLLARFGVLLGIFLIILAVMANQHTLQRSLGEKTYAPLTFDSSRIITFRKAFNNSGTWLRGYGLGCFYQKDVRHEIHNTPFSILVEAGIPGFLVFSTLCLLILIKTLNSPVLYPDLKLREGLLICLGGIFAIGMFHNLIRNRASWLITAIAITYVALAAKEFKNEK